MTPKPTDHHILPAAPKKWKLLLMLFGIFLCGGILGGVIAQHFVREQMLWIMRHPDELPNRVVPRIVDRLNLNGEQTVQLEPLIRGYFARMEAFRAQTYPQQVAEFDAMCMAISKELDKGQQKEWTALTAEIRQRFIPVASVGPPPTDFLFTTFDVNHDQSLDESEVPPPMWNGVQNADVNNDGVITKIEFQAAQGH